MRIGGREIGPGEPPYVIAEIGVNHDGEVARALELTDAAAEAGADAVKLQYFETDRLMSKAAKLAAYQKAAGETDPVAMLRRLELTLDEMALVVERAHERGIHAIVTVFSVELVKPAAGLSWDAFKTASPDVVNRPLLEALAAEGKPLIVSTGASTLNEVERAVRWLHDFGVKPAVLQCVSSYPTQPADSAILALREVHRPGWMDRDWSWFIGAIGYSDHTQAVDTGWLASRAGHVMLEKHLTYSTNAVGPDHKASLQPPSFSEYVRCARAGAEALAMAQREDPENAMSPLVGICEGRTADLPRLGDGTKRVLDCERDVREVSRQSVVTTRALAPGDVIARDDLTIKRPGTGIGPWRFDEVVGRRVGRAVEADVPLRGADVEGWADMEGG